MGGGGDGILDYDTVIEISSRYLKRVEQLDEYASVILLLKQMLLDFAQKTGQSRLLTNTPVVKKISRDVSAYLYEKTSPAAIAHRLGMSASYLCRHFKQETGKTISAYINEVKMTEGKRLLESTDLSLVEISAQLGYSSQNYFHRVFKKTTGLTPAEYRNSLR
jgi:AraC-like DNA-binding protein